MFSVDETEFEKTFKNVSEARVIGQWLRRLDFIAKAAGTTYRVGVIGGYVGRTELRRVVASIQEPCPLCQSNATRWTPFRA